MKINKFLIFWLCAACLFVYAGSVGNDFVFDDKALIVHNPLIKSAMPLPAAFGKGIYDHWAGQAAFDRMYRPLQVLTYWVDYRIWGLQPFGFRITNILIHLFNAVLIYLFLSLAVSDKKLAALASILFFVHPFNSPVAWYISARADLLSCFFMVLSAFLFLKYIRDKQAAFYGLGIICAAAALLSRENAVFLFLCIASILLVEKAPLKTYALLIPFILLDIAYIGLRLFVFGASGLYAHPDILSLPLRLVNFFNIVFRYTLFLFVPLDLHLFRGTAFIRCLFCPQAAVVVIMAALYAFILIRYRENKAVFFGSLWFAAAITPVWFLLDGYPMFGQAMMAENWVYMSSAGFFVLFAAVLGRLKNLGAVLLYAFIIFYGLLSAVNNVYWKNDILVHQRIIEYNPEPNPVRKDLVDDYLAAGMYAKALQEAKTFSRYCPAAALSDVVWGNYYFAIGQVRLAAESYELAVKKTSGRDIFLRRRLDLCYRMMAEKGC